MRFRTLNKLYAKTFGYFWLPCPNCGQYCGGHEWKDGHSIEYRTKPGETGTCADCPPIVHRAEYAEDLPFYTKLERARHE